MKETIQFVKINNTFHAIETHVNHDHMQNVLTVKRVIREMNKRGF